jgi:hypothetical protein
MGGVIGIMQQSDVRRNLPAPKHRYPRQTGHDLSQQLQSLAAHFGSENAYSDKIAAWMARQRAPERDTRVEVLIAALCLSAPLHAMASAWPVAGMPSQHTLHHGFQGVGVFVMMSHRMASSTRKYS